MSEKLRHGMPVWVHDASPYASGEQYRARVIGRQRNDAEFDHEPVVAVMLEESMPEQPDRPELSPGHLFPKLLASLVHARPGGVPFEELDPAFRDRLLALDPRRAIYPHHVWTMSNEECVCFLDAREASTAADARARLLEKYAPEDDPAAWTPAYLVRSMLTGEQLDETGDIDGATLLDLVDLPEDP